MKARDLLSPSISSFEKSDRKHPGWRAAKPRSPPRKWFSKTQRANVNETSQVDSSSVCSSRRVKATETEKLRKGNGRSLLRRLTSRSKSRQKDFFAPLQDDNDEYTDETETVTQASPPAYAFIDKFVMGPDDHRAHDMSFHDFSCSETSHSGRISSETRTEPSTPTSASKPIHVDRFKISVVAAERPRKGNPSTSSSLSSFDATFHDENEDFFLMAPNQFKTTGKEVVFGHMTSLLADSDSVQSFIDEVRFVKSEAIRESVEETIFSSPNTQPVMSVRSREEDLRSESFEVANMNDLNFSWEGTETVETGLPDVFDQPSTHQSASKILDGDWNMAFSIHDDEGEGTEIIVLFQTENDTGAKIDRSRLTTPTSSAIDVPAEAKKGLFMSFHSLGLGDQSTISSRKSVRSHHLNEEIETEMPPTESGLVSPIVKPRLVMRDWSDTTREVQYTTPSTPSTSTKTGSLGAETNVSGLTWISHEDDCIQADDRPMQEILIPPSYQPTSGTIQNEGVPAKRKPIENRPQGADDCSRPSPVDQPRDGFEIVNRRNMIDQGLHSAPSDISFVTEDSPVPHAIPEQGVVDHCLQDFKMPLKSSTPCATPEPDVVDHCQQNFHLPLTKAISLPAMLRRKLHSPIRRQASNTSVSTEDRPAPCEIPGLAEVTMCQEDAKVPLRKTISLTSMMRRKPKLPAKSGPETTLPRDLNHSFDTPDPEPINVSVWVSQNESDSVSSYRDKNQSRPESTLTRANPISEAMAVNHTDSAALLDEQNLMSLVDENTEDDGEGTADGEDEYDFDDREEDDDDLDSEIRRFQQYQARMHRKESFSPDAGKGPYSPSASPGDGDHDVVLNEYSDQDFSDGHTEEDSDMDHYAGLARNRSLSSSSFSSVASAPLPGLDFIQRWGAQLVGRAQVLAQDGMQSALKTFA
jgi:hypothetical protein